MARQFDPQSVPVFARLPQWSLQAIRLMARKPLECIAITILLIVVSIFLCNHLSRFSVNMILAVVIQVCVPLATALAIDADGRHITMARRDIAHTVMAAALIQIFMIVFWLILAVAIEIVITGYRTAMIWIAGSMLSASAVIKCMEMVLNWNLWWLIGMVFVWPLLLEGGMSLPSALLHNQNGKAKNGLLQLVIIFFILIVDMFPVIAIPIILFIPFFSYVVYRDIFLNIQENSKVPVLHWQRA